MLTSLTKKCINIELLCYSNDIIEKAIKHYY